MRDYPAAVTARHALIMRWLTEDGRLDVATVAERLGVAQETVRRDLRALESDRRLQRVHGGAVPIEAHPFPGSATPLTAEPDDHALASWLWARLPHSGTLLLGTGRLTLALIAAMTSAPPLTRGLTVVTNSLDAAIAAARVPMLSVYNIGGSVSALTRAQEGDWALQELDRLQVDVSVICPAGISVQRGLAQATPAAAAVSAAEVACGRIVIAVVDATNFGRSAFVQFAPIDRVDQVLVSGSASPRELAAFRERGVDVLAFDESATADSVNAHFTESSSVAASARSSLK
jgi:DeoR family transcriptional regulator, fructose operon transcriptional repressor